MESTVKQVVNQPVPHSSPVAATTAAASDSSAQPTPAAESMHPESSCSQSALTCDNNDNYNPSRTVAADCNDNNYSAQQHIPTPNTTMDSETTLTMTEGTLTVDDCQDVRDEPIQFGNLEAADELLIKSNADQIVTFITGDAQLDQPEQWTQASVASEFELVLFYSLFSLFNSVYF